MAIMSFAHLKTKNTPEQVPVTTPPPSGLSTVVRNQPAANDNRPSASPGIMSFAHLKTRSPKPDPAIIHEEETQPSVPRIFRIPFVAPSALLIAVNYCQGCGRFLPAGEAEKPHGNPYGRCLREGEIGSGREIWKVIKRHVTVSRCFFFKNQ